ncbi:hypothetical protein [Methylophaga sp. OBS1]|uniref:hypothetical protein n=1 Tax=Methylophaga sp. OBS1 TaxID=2991933 RepID=UPI002251BCEF|nr:hypothetical protein [Methylophaga sp. OBS1]MCX4192260.1 hypothetical protein [Methylophaga sp. OBS1]
MSELSTQWWGSFAVAKGEQRVLRCADLYLQLQALPNQWWLGYDWQRDINQFQPILETLVEELAETPEHEQRFVFAELPSRLRLLPALADRPVVCRPVVSVSLLPFQEVTLFVCLPLWVKLQTGEGDVTLLDIPTVRVCDSWFGPNTREGVISYASQVSEQLDVKPISNNKARAAIEVRIQNQSDQMLTLDKISVPAPNLSLYVDAYGQFWTPRITLVRRDNEDAILSVDEVVSGGLPESELTLVCDAREDIGRSKITKAISALFG